MICEQARLSGVSISQVALYLRHPSRKPGPRTDGHRDHGSDSDDARKKRAIALRSWTASIRNRFSPVSTISISTAG